MQPRTMIGLVLLAAAGTLLLASLYIKQSQKELSLTLQIRIAEQAQTLTTISTLTHQNRADSLAESIIRDCSTDSRARYADLLNDLANLRGAELQELEQVFEACAGFFAEQKAVMVARLSRELEVYEEYVQLLATLKDSDPIVDSQLDTWQELVTLETERSQLMTEQVSVQGEIITALKTLPATDDSVEERLVRAQQITTRVTTINSEIEALRTVLQNV